MTGDVLTGSNADYMSTLYEELENDPAALRTELERQLAYIQEAGHLAVFYTEPTDQQPDHAVLAMSRTDYDERLKSHNEGLQWSGETSVAQLPLALLAEDPHTVTVVGKNPLMVLEIATGLAAKMIDRQRAVAADKVPFLS